MARVIAPGAAKRLGLPGRASYEIVSGAMGSKAVTLRRVEIPVPTGDAPGRAATSVLIALTDRSVIDHATRRDTAHWRRHMRPFS